MGCLDQYDAIALFADIWFDDEALAKIDFIKVIMNLA